MNAIESKQESDYRNSSEYRIKTSLDECFKKIEEQSKQGAYEAIIYSGHIDKECEAKLIELGYKVRLFEKEFAWPKGTLISW
jgi:UDP-galactopyranose mutase